MKQQEPAQRQEPIQPHEIELLLPIRDPYLWIDEVIEISTTQIHARKHLSADLDVFRGHYVNFPVFPGALQCECAFQAAGLLIARTRETTDGLVPVIARMNNVKFRRLVRPGDTLDVYVELLETRRRMLQMKSTIKVAEKITTQLEFAVSEVTLTDANPYDR